MTEGGGGKAFCSVKAFLYKICPHLSFKAIDASPAQDQIRGWSVTPAAGGGGRSRRSRSHLEGPPGGWKKLREWAGDPVAEKHGSSRGSGRERMVPVAVEENLEERPSRLWAGFCLLGDERFQKRSGRDGEKLRERCRKPAWVRRLRSASITVFLHEFMELSALSDVIADASSCDHLPNLTPGCHMINPAVSKRCRPSALLG